MKYYPLKHDSFIGGSVNIDMKQTDEGSRWISQALVRDAVEGLKQYLKNKSEEEHRRKVTYGEGSDGDFWDAKHIATYEALECVDLWFPAFVKKDTHNGSYANKEGKA